MKTFLIAILILITADLAVAQEVKTIDGVLYRCEIIDIEAEKVREADLANEIIELQGTVDAKKAVLNAIEESKKPKKDEEPLIDVPIIEDTVSGVNWDDVSYLDDEVYERVCEDVQSTDCAQWKRDKKEEAKQAALKESSDKQEIVIKVVLEQTPEVTTKVVYGEEK